MEVYDILFAINLLMLIGVITYNCFKKDRKAVLSNAIVLFAFILIKVAQIYYVDIRSFLLDILGEERFLHMRDIISAALMFGSSITVGLQLIAELVNIVLLLFFATRTVAILVKKCAKDIFSSNVRFENEKAVDKFKDNGNEYIYLVYGNLLN